MFSLVGLSFAQDSTQSTRPASPAPSFKNDSSSFTNSGSIKLRWQRNVDDKSNAAIEFELERATLPDFSDAKPYYRGPDRATYISGLADGNYYYRVRELSARQPVSAWSTPITVKVAHHSLSLAFTLFAIGGVVFICTLLIVLRGAARTADPDKQPGSSTIEAGH